MMCLCHTFICIDRSKKSDVFASANNNQLGSERKKNKPESGNDKSKDSRKKKEKEKERILEDKFCKTGEILYTFN